MAIEGINNNILEILFTSDKSIENFTRNIKEGDFLQGRVIEVFPQENRALINFRGYNVISQLPPNFNVEKGDIIQSLITKISDRIYMKLLDNSSNNIGRGNIPLLDTITPENIINILNSLKMPINEHNIIITQKLIEFKIPVTKKNIEDINSYLNKFLEEKGLNINDLLNDTKIDLQVSKEKFLNEFIKLHKQILNISTNYNSENEIIFLKNDLPKVINTLNNINALRSSLSKEIFFSTTKNDLNIHIKINNDSELKNLVDFLVKSNLINSKNKNSILQQQLNTGSIDFSNNDINISFTKGILDIKLNNFISIIDNLKTNTKEVKEVNLFMQNLLKNLNEITYNSLKNIYNSSTDEIFSFDMKNDKDIIKAFLITIHPKISENIENIKNNINRFTTPIDREEMLNILKNINDNLQSVIKNFNSQIENLTQKQSQLVITKFINEVKNFQKTISQIISNTDVNFSKTETYYFNPENITNLISEMKNFSLFKLFNEINFTEMVQDNGGVPNSNRNVNISLNSILEALVFLKSRALPFNTKFVDIMTKYFNEDLKLNTNLQKLSDSIKKFNLEVNNYNISKYDIENIQDTIQNIKKIIDEIIIKINNNNLKQDIIINQFKNFIEKSGLPLESKMKDFVLNININTKENNQVNTSQLFSLKDNLKSALIALNKNIDNFINFHPKFKHIFSDIKNNIDNTLTNLNALQFINHRPISFDMIYTQIPVLFGNNIFNGEIQIWYRKGSIKQNLEDSNPVNLMFLLNTSNLGRVKVSLTVYRNNLNCNIKTENEKIKQQLMKNKNEFLNSLNKISYKVNYFNIEVETKERQKEDNMIRNEYINIGKINFTA